MSGSWRSAHLNRWAAWAAPARATTPRGGVCAAGQRNDAAGREVERHGARTTRRRTSSGVTPSITSAPMSCACSGRCTSTGSRRRRRRHVSEQAERYDWVAAEFSKRVDGVPATAWENPAPVEGWVARDVVGHLVEWLPAFFCGTWGVEPPKGPSVDEDPAGAWHALDAMVRGAFADPAIAD